MSPSRDFMHAHLGTHRDLLSEMGFMTLIELAEAFNDGSPFTICRCAPLGDGEMNLTGTVRRALEECRWMPESGAVDMILQAPANGRRFALQMRLPVDPGHLAEVRYEFGLDYFGSSEVASTRAFFRGAISRIRADFAYLHYALDEAAQDARNTGRFRALTGREPRRPVDWESNPGRSERAGPYLISCRWMMSFGGTLLDQIGRARLLSAPCVASEIGKNHVLLQLYSDPLTYDDPANRETQIAVRAHLALDDLADSVRWERVERRPTGSYRVVDDSAEEPEEERVTTDDRPAIAAGLPLHVWATLYDATISGLPGEAEFYCRQARDAAGRVLQLSLGTGRILLPVIKTGVPVVGLDPSAEIIAHLRRRLSLEAPTIQTRAMLLSGHVVDTPFEDYGPFAAVFIPFRGVNRLSGPTELRQTLAQLYKHLSPGGILAFSTFFPTIDSWSSEIPTNGALRHVGTNPATGAKFLARDTIEVQPVSQHLNISRHLIDLDDRGRVVNERYLFLDLRYYYPSELELLLELTGFKATTYGGFSGELLTSQENEIVIVAHRI